MVFFEKRRVRKSASYHCVFGQLVTDVRGSETVTDTGELGRFTPVEFLHSVDPSWYRDIGEGCMFAFPSLIVKVFVLRIMTVFSVFPDRVLLVFLADIFRPQWLE